MTDQLAVNLYYDEMPEYSEDVTGIDLTQVNIVAGQQVHMLLDDKYLLALTPESFDEVETACWRMRQELSDEPSLRLGMVLNPQLAAVIRQMKLACDCDEATLMGTALSLLRIHVTAAQRGDDIRMGEDQIVMPLEVKEYPSVE